MNLDTFTTIGYPEPQTVRQAVRLAADLAELDTQLKDDPLASTQLQAEILRVYADVARLKIMSTWRLSEPALTEYDVPVLFAIALTYPPLRTIADTISVIKALAALRSLVGESLLDSEGLFRQWSQALVTEIDTETEQIKNLRIRG